MFDTVRIEEAEEDEVAGTVTFDTIGITDSAGSMGKLGKHLRDNDKEHGYCTDHIIHLVAKRAFDRKFYLVTEASSQWLTIQLFRFTAVDVPDIREAIEKARSIATFFNKSTQAMTDLKQQQASSQEPLSTVVAQRSALLTLSQDGGPPTAC